MKRFIIFLLPAILCFTTIDSTAQLKNIGKRVKKKVQDRIDQRFDQAVDGALNKTEGEIVGAATGDGEQAAEGTESGATGAADGTAPVADPGAAAGTNDAAAGTATGAAATGAGTFAVNTKFDYVPGETLMVFDDFELDAIGDFPSRWNTDGTGEVVTLGDSDDKWFMMKSGADYIPDLPRGLPEEYTIEFDLTARGLSDQTASSTLLEVILDENNVFESGKNFVKVRIPFCQYHPVGFYVRNAVNNDAIINNQIQADIRQQVLNRPHISIAVNKTRFRLWVNEQKYIDIPRMVPPGNITKYLKFRPYYFKDGVEDIFIRNLKIAEGGLDLRSQLLRDGMVSTNGILFDVNSATIQPESYGVIRQIAMAMEEETAMKLNIIGHTDSDGADTDNLNLSQKRAESVKNSLVNDFGISVDRLTIEGKGASQPVAENGTPEGKAANRRVEFVSL